MNEADDRRRRLVRIGVLVGAALAVLVVLIVASQSGSGDEEREAGKPGEIAAVAPEVEERFAGIEQSGTSLGAPDAPAVVQEFVDPQCPFCAEYTRQALPEVLDRYVRTGRVRFELGVLHFLGRDSTDAARFAAAAALQDRMWQFMDLFFLNQGEENSGYVTDSFLRDIGERTPGLDVDEAFEMRDSPAARRILSDARRAAEAVNAQSTPSFYFSLRGSAPRPLELNELNAASMTEALDEALGDE